MTGRIKTTMPREFQRIMGCEGKVKYADMSKAHQAQKKQRGGRMLRIYRCRFCEAFHLATRRENER